MKKTKKKLNKKKKELNKNFNKIINKNNFKNNVKNQMTRAKKSLIRTKFSFENLEPNLKNELLNKINKTKLL